MMMWSRSAPAIWLLGDATADRPCILPPRTSRAGRLGAIGAPSAGLAGSPACVCSCWPIRTGIEKFLFDELEELRWIHRLRDIRGPGVPRFGFEDRIGESADNDCRYRAWSRNDELKAVVLVQPDIGDQQIRWRGAQDVQCVAEGADRGGLVPRLVEQLRQAAPRRGIVIDDEYAFSAHGSQPSGGGERDPEGRSALVDSNNPTTYVELARAATHRQSSLVHGRCSDYADPDFLISPSIVDSMPVQLVRQTTSRDSWCSQDISSRAPGGPFRNTD